MVSVTPVSYTHLLEMFLGDMRKEIGTYFAALESKLELVLNQISNLNKEKITTYSIADIDAQIRLSLIHI